MKNVHEGHFGGILFNSSDFEVNTFLLRQMAKAQMFIDKEFKKKLFDLSRKLREKREPFLPAFWAQYKKILITSVGKNNKKLNQLIKSVDNDMKKQIKEVQKNAGKPPIDLSLPK